MPPGHGKRKAVVASDSEEEAGVSPQRASQSPLKRPRVTDHRDDEDDVDTDEEEDNDTQRRSSNRHSNRVNGSQVRGTQEDHETDDDDEEVGDPALEYGRPELDRGDDGYGSFPAMC